MDLSTKENTVSHALSPSVVGDHQRSVTIEPEPLRPENDAATQVPSQDSEDKNHRSGHSISSLHQSQQRLTPSELTISPLSPPDEVLLSSDWPTDLNHPTASSMKEYVDWYVNVFMSKEQRAVWDTPQILDFLESVDAFKAKGHDKRTTASSSHGNLQPDSMDAQQLATDMDMDLSDAVDVYLASWVIDDEDDAWFIESTNMDDEDGHSWSLIEWICDMVHEENDFVLAFLIEQHQLFTDELTAPMQAQGDDA